MNALSSRPAGEIYELSRLAASIYRYFSISWWPPRFSLKYHDMGQYSGCLKWHLLIFLDTGISVAISSSCLSHLPSIYFGISKERALEILIIFDGRHIGLDWRILMPYAIIKSGQFNAPQYLECLRRYAQSSFTNSLLHHLWKHCVPHHSHCWSYLTEQSLWQ